MSVESLIVEKKAAWFDRFVPLAERVDLVELGIVSDELERSGNVEGAALVRLAMEAIAVVGLGVRDVGEGPISRKR